MSSRRSVSKSCDEGWLKGRIIDYLRNEGYKITHVSEGKSHGVDMKCYHPVRRRYYFVEVKPEPNPMRKSSIGAMRENYFLGALAELILRMNQIHGRYGIGLPNNKSYVRKLKKIPKRIRKLLALDIFLVDARGNVDVIGPGDDV